MLLLQLLQMFCVLNLRSDKFFQIIGLEVSSHNVERSFGAWFLNAPLPESAGLLVWELTPPPSLSLSNYFNGHILRRKLRDDTRR